MHSKHLSNPDSRKHAREDDLSGDSESTTFAINLLNFAFEAPSPPLTELQLKTTPATAKSIHAEKRPRIWEEQLPSLQTWWDQQDFVEHLEYDQNLSTTSTTTTTTIPAIVTVGSNGMIIPGQLPRDNYHDSPDYPSRAVLREIVYNNNPPDLVKMNDSTNFEATKGSLTHILNDTEEKLVRTSAFPSPDCATTPAAPARIPPIQPSIMEKHSSRLATEGYQRFNGRAFNSFQFSITTPTSSERRATQNRLAQRAFRQRKDLHFRYVQQRAFLFETAQQLLGTLRTRLQSYRPVLRQLLEQNTTVSSNVHHQTLTFMESSASSPIPDEVLVSESCLDMYISGEFKQQLKQDYETVLSQIRLGRSTGGIQFSALDSRWLSFQ